MKTLLGLWCVLSVQLSPPAATQQVAKNGMHVRWKSEGNSLHFVVQAPTEGWVAIGFNEDERMADTYLLMGHVEDGRAEVVEYYVAQPGRYRPITEYGAQSTVLAVAGEETSGTTTLKFSIPRRSDNRYRKALPPRSEWKLVMAYSVDDDFRHHSAMRTSAEVQM